MHLAYLHFNYKATNNCLRQGKNIIIAHNEAYIIIFPYSNVILN